MRRRRSPNTDVLQNKPGIRDGEALRTFEHEAAKIRTDELRENPIKGKFDLKHLQDIHKHIFQDVYGWAGEVRSVNISKGGTAFARSEFIESEGKRIARDIAKDDFLRGMDKPAFVDRLAYHYAELNALHPFREGNGRSTREFIGQLSREAGYEFDQTRIDNKDRWNEAARKSVNGDMVEIKAIFNESIRDPRAFAFEKLPPSETIAKHPELATAYAALTAIDKQAEAHGVNANQREVIAAYAKSKATAGLEKGDIPQVRLREETYNTKQPEPER